MRRLLVTLAIIAGCASEPDGSSGQGTTIIDPDILVVALTHEQIGIDVYKDNAFLMTGNCRSMRGKLDDSEMASLKGYMADGLIQSLGTECGTGEYRITIGLGAQSKCWTKDQKGSALEGLSAFFDSKAAQLAETPAGQMRRRLPGRRRIEVGQGQEGSGRLRRLTSPC